MLEFQLESRVGGTASSIESPNSDYGAFHTVFFGFLMTIISDMYKYGRFFGVFVAKLTGLDLRVLCSESLALPFGALL